MYAKDKIITNKKNELIIEKDGIEELIKISYEKSQKAILPAIIKSVLGYLLPADYNNCAKCFFQPGSCQGSVLDPIDNKKSSK